MRVDLDLGVLPLYIVFRVVEGVVWRWWLCIVTQAVVVLCATTRMHYEESLGGTRRPKNFVFACSTPRGVIRGVTSVVARETLFDGTWYVGCVTAYDT